MRVSGASRCCSSANQFFGSNCQNDNFIYAQATGPFGFTDASLRAGAGLACCSSLVTCNGLLVCLSWQAHGVVLR